MPPDHSSVLSLHIATLDAMVLRSAVVAPDSSRESPGTLLIDRGLAWPMLVADPRDRQAWALLAPILSRGTEPDEIRVVDGAGHERPLYVPLLTYAGLQAVRASDDVLVHEQAEAIFRWIERATDVRLPAAVGGESNASAPSLPAARGDSVAEFAWGTLVLHTAADLLLDDRLAVAARGRLRDLCARQRPAGHFLVPGARDNPETWWFHELAIAHAVASLAWQTGDDVAMESAKRAASYHLAETQPDHATNDPWGLTAFLCDADTAIMADQLLHAMHAKSTGVSPIGLILLADTLYSLRCPRPPRRSTPACST